MSIVHRITNGWDFHEESNRSNHRTRNSSILSINRFGYKQSTCGPFIALIHYKSGYR